MKDFEEPRADVNSMSSLTSSSTSFDSLDCSRTKTDESIKNEIKTAETDASKGRMAEPRRLQTSNLCLHCAKKTWQNEHQHSLEIGLELKQITFASINDTDCRN